MGYVNKVQVSNAYHLVEPTLYGISTLSGTSYTSAIDNFTLVTGVTVAIKIATTNPANATLNVTSTGAKDIVYSGARIAASKLKVNHIYTFVYDGTNWQLTGDIDDNNTDTLVKQTVKTDDVNYKILGTATSSPTSGNAMEATYSANIYANPSTGSVSGQRHTWNIAGNDKAYTYWNEADASIDFVFN